MWCLSLERQTCTALNSSNPTPILAHAFGHFPATGSLTAHSEVLGVRSPSLLCSVWVGSCIRMYACLLTRTAVCAQREEGVKCDVNVEAIWAERLGFKSEGQITGFAQNKDTLMTLGCDKQQERRRFWHRLVPGFLQMLLMQKPPRSKIQRQGYWRAIWDLHASDPNAYPILVLHINIPSNTSHTITVTWGQWLNAIQTGICSSSPPYPPQAFTCPS